jgi:hypothetical protein
MGKLYAESYVFLKIYFPAGIRPLFPKSEAVRPPFFLANQFLFSAGFELFCKTFGRLATVIPVVH